MQGTGAATIGGDGVPQGAAGMQGTGAATIGGDGVPQGSAGMLGTGTGPTMAGPTMAGSGDMVMAPAGDMASGGGQQPASVDMVPVASGNACGLPEVTDLGATGPYDDAQLFAGVGPSSNYTLFRPTTSLGRDGVKHPVAVWGNGIATTPDQYTSLLLHIASHGFVVIACNDTRAERVCLDDGMTWLVAQNDSGELAGKLDIQREVTIGYSWGGGAAIDTANRPNVKTTVSIHGMPPREANAFVDMHAPLLLFTATGDTFVNATQYVTPNYEASTVPTFYATLDEPVGHLYPLDDGSAGCVAGPVFVGANQGPCASAEKERAPIVAWLRLWACEDPQAKAYFYGEGCLLCQSPWSAKSKPAGAFD